MVAGLLAALAAAFSLLDIVSWDYWWQLRTGRLIWETGGVPDRDPFSYTAPAARYIDIHWLFQLWLFAVHALGGHAAVVVGKLGFVALTLGLLAPIGGRADRAAVSGAGLALVVVLLAERIMPRAELPSFALLAAVLLGLDRMRRPGGRRFAIAVAIVGLQLVWANTHGLFAVGIAVCAIHFAGDVFDRLTRDDAKELAPGLLVGVVAASVLVSFLNPNGLDGVLYPVAQLGMIGPVGSRALGASIVELQPTLGQVGPAIGGAALALLVIALAALLANRREAPTRDWLLVVAFAYLALTARRNLSLYAIVVAPIAITHVNAWLDAREGRWSPRRSMAVTAALALAVVALLVDVLPGRFHERLGVPREPGLGVMRTWYSEGAADWILANRPPGKVAHAMPDGGLFVERLYPAYRVMVDGRLEVYGPELLERLAWTTPEEFQALYREYRFGTVVVHYSKIPSGEMLRWLHVRPAWQLVFVDEVSAVYVRDGGRVGRFSALDVDADDLFPAFTDEGRVQTELRLRGRALFYSALEREGRVRAVVALARRHYPDLELASP